MASTTVRLMRAILVTAATAATAAGVFVLLGPSRRRAPREPQFAANVSSGVFHRVSCRMYDADGSAPVFASREEALAEGFRPCGICKP